MVDQLVDERSRRGDQPASAELVRSLEDDILTGNLKPGERLDELSLARRFNVSRTPVREALRQLSASGLIDIRRNQGAMVKRLRPSDLVEMFQVVAELEGLAARLSARRMNKDECDELRAHNQQCERKQQEGDLDGFFKSNNAFHEAIFRASRNKFLQEEAGKLRRRTDVYRRHITSQPRRMQNSVREHEGIIEAIEAGNEELADRLMRDHLDVLGGAAADVLLTLEHDFAGGQN